MGPEDLKQAFKSHASTVELLSCLKAFPPKKISLTGLKGSSIAFIANSIFREIGGTHLFIVPEREQAAYLLNDLENVIGKERVLFFPASWKKPYDPEAIENANILYRSEALNTIEKGSNNLIIVTYPQALVEKVVTRDHLASNTFKLHKGEKTDSEFLIDFLTEYEFERVDFVTKPGEFSIRGGIIDVFSFSNDLPYRIEFFDNEIESIRSFEIESQLSIAYFEYIHIVPNIQNKLLRESRQSFFEFIPPSTVIWSHGESLNIDMLGKYYEQVCAAWEKNKNSLIRQLPPEESYISSELMRASLGTFRRVDWHKPFPESPHNISFNQTPQPNFNKNFDLLITHLRDKNKQGQKILLFADTQKQLERIFSVLEDVNASRGYRFPIDEVCPFLYSIHEGFTDETLKISCYTDHQIFDRYHRFKLKDQGLQRAEALTLKELQGLKPGDYVTHIDHGVGKFDGLEKIEVNGKLQETIRLIYKDNDIVYVSIHSLHRIAKYTGQEGTIPKLNKIGTNTWSNLKERTKKKVKEIAFDLIKLYAKRKMSKGFAFSHDTYLQTELEASFIYEDTPDQIKCTADVKKDMESPSPMDRLVCGDVGFGKTEIALRAAFKAVADSKQVAVLVPTTILALQHFRTFSERLKNMPCKVDFINRFKSTAETKKTLEELAQGKIDILIGTHKILGKEIKFKDLGLMIIDEEQKFGVAAKDKLKTMRANIDTLTLTATPIPRTLQFSMMGARDLSVITTPPPNRYPVQTEVTGFNEEKIRDAVAFEISRGGQVFFVHNRVQNIKEVAGMISRLCPDAKVLIGHGQMEGEKLEEALVDFINGDFDVLVSTTIIESGLDIPNANTIIINNAHLFGLSDLHQMRGRVGRSNKRAFCYLLTPPPITLTEEARKRLKAIEEFAGLGSGFNIAMRDLDIRGAGNLLGAEQSGFISEIGFDMYMKILNEAITELKETEFKDIYEKTSFRDRKNALSGVYGQTFISDCQLDTDLPLGFPDEYISNTAERIALYRELDEMQSPEGLEKFRSNLNDRFGALPKESAELLEVIPLRWKAIELGIEKIIIRNNRMTCYFISKADSPYYQSESFSAVLQFVKTEAATGKLKETPNGKLTLSFQGVNHISAAMEKLNKVLSYLNNSYHA